MFVSNDWNGPWHYVGFGTGTQGYDLIAVAGMSTARFVRIVDDGNGGSGGNAGFDLDAIEAVVVNAPAVVYQGQTDHRLAAGRQRRRQARPGRERRPRRHAQERGRLGVSSLTGGAQDQRRVRLGARTRPATYGGDPAGLDPLERRRPVPRRRGRQHAAGARRRRCGCT